jgi:hypothetical protein
MSFLLDTNILSAHLRLPSGGTFHLYVIPRTVAAREEDGLTC